ncbi:TolC family protein [Cupriavidus lacunae]|nr:TolC family protein [Cupriavidus lacunae]
MKRFWIATMLAVGANCAAPTVRAADLATVMAEAIAYDAGYAAARAAAEIGREAVPRARAALLPRIDAGWGRAYNQVETEDFPAVRYWQNGWSVGLTQPVFDWGRWMAYRQASLAEARAEVELARFRQDLLLRVSRAYFGYLAADDEAARATGYLKAVTEQRTLIERRRAGGEATVVDAREAQAQVIAAQLMQANARTAQQASRRAIETLIGRPFVACSRLPAVIAPMRRAPDADERWIDRAGTKSYPVQLAEIEVSNAQYETRKVRAQQYPVVAVTGSHSPAGSASGYARPTTTTTAMLTVTLPVFAGGEMQASLRAALASEDKFNSALHSAARQASADARESLRKLHWAGEQHALLGQLVQSREDTLAATRIGYTAGSRANLDVLRALDALYLARQEQLRASYDMLLAFLQLKADVAALSFDDIAHVDNLLVNRDPSNSECNASER